MRRAGGAWMQWNNFELGIVDLLLLGHEQEACSVERTRAAYKGRRTSNLGLRRGPQGPRFQCSRSDRRDAVMSGSSTNSIAVRSFVRRCTSAPMPGCTSTGPAFESDAPSSRTRTR